MESHDVIVVGAGLAGLTCAVELSRAGVDVAVLESSDAVGGRIRTDRVDSMLLDRGFQLLNPAYPALAGLVDLAALDLQFFEAGVVVASLGDRVALADPFRSPRDLRQDAARSTGSVLEKACFAAYAARCALDAPSRLRRLPDVGYGEALERARVRGRLRRSVLEPFLAGVLAEDEQRTSRRFVDLLLRMFARAAPGLPAGGMHELPQQIADLLPAGTVRLESRVEAVAGRTVQTAEGAMTADAVVVATDPLTAAALTSLPTPVTRGLTTFYHHVAESPAQRRLLHVDGDRNGPIVNTAVVSDVAARYCPDGALVATTVLGADDGSEMLARVERQLADIYGVGTSDWRLVRAYRIPVALPAMLPPLDFRQPVELGDGVFIAGDHRDTASIQGAIVSGRRAASAVRASLHSRHP